MQEQRTFPRRAVKIDGKLIFAKGRCIVDCVIVDVSEGGARLFFGMDVSVPDRVYLWQRATGTVFECEVRWREGRSIGLRFLDTCGRSMRRSLIDACMRVEARSRISRWLDAH